jgi:hypothetical protein
MEHAFQYPEKVVCTSNNVAICFKLYSRTIIPRPRAVSVESGNNEENELVY